MALTFCTSRSDRRHDGSFSIIFATLQIDATISGRDLHLPRNFCIPFEAKRLLQCCVGPVPSAQTAPFWSNMIKRVGMEHSAYGTLLAKVRPCDSEGQL
jgi:hypothetical protein